VKTECSFDGQHGGGAGALAAPASSGRAAFTLIEMLVVIAILGLIAGLTVPALKNLGKADATVSAGRQLLDDIGRARQLAISQRTTVYMVFVPESFWANTTYNSAATTTPWMAQLTFAEKSVVTNLCGAQLTGYVFIGRGTVGDQPGRHNWRYLSSWQTLPAGTFIAPLKFRTPKQVASVISLENNPNSPFTVYGFMTNAVPFPVETNSALFLNLTCLMFDSLGHLVDESGQVLSRHEYIPLARGSVAPSTDPATKTYQLSAPSVAEVPSGNSTNISANIIDIDPLTGRALLQFFKMEP
jgi:prepilin-type N-terminal cleavage/methylation domain-containing protein